MHEIHLSVRGQEYVAFATKLQEILRTMATNQHKIPADAESLQQLFVPTLDIWEHMEKGDMIPNFESYIEKLGDAEFMRDCILGAMRGSGELGQAVFQLSVLSLKISI